MSELVFAKLISIHIAISHKMRIFHIVTFALSAHFSVSQQQSHPAPNQFSPYSFPKVQTIGKGLDGTSAVLTIVGSTLKIADRASSFGLCCLSDGGGFCPDGSKHDNSKTVGFLGIGRGHCSTKSCNVYGCNCDGFCKTGDGGITVALCTSSSSSTNGKCEANSIHRKNFRIQANQQCLNLEDDFNDKTRTLIPIDGACVRIWEKKDCKGDYRDIARERKLSSVYMLDGRTFSDQVSSLSHCKNSDETTYSSKGYLCESPCAKYGQSYFWCDARGSIGNMVNDQWDYCSRSPGEDSAGQRCRDSCDHRGSTRYKWCNNDKGSWGYCSEDAKHYAHGHHTRYGQKCSNPCSKYNEDYYWCFGHSDQSTSVESTGKYSWDYCSPAPEKTINGANCRSSHTCGRYGLRYCWCYTDEKNNWDYCACLDKNGYSDVTRLTRYGIKCSTACERKHSGDYSVCYTDSDGNWDYCSFTSGETIQGKKCRSNHVCGRNGQKYCWCYTDNSNNWDYCSCPPRNAKELVYSTRRGLQCIDTCEKQGKNYFWCYENRGPNYPFSSVSDWDYCSPAPGLTIYGQMCKSEHSCGKYGKGYCWCYTDSKNNWDYCSSNTCV